MSVVAVDIGTPYGDEAVWRTNLEQEGIGISWRTKSGCGEGCRMHGPEEELQQKGIQPNHRRPVGMP